MVRDACLRDLGKDRKPNRTHQVNKNLMFALDARYTRSRTLDGYRTTTVAFNCGQVHITHVTK